MANKVSQSIGSKMRNVKHDDALKVQTGNNEVLVKEESITIGAGASHTIDNIDVSKFAKLIGSIRETSGVAHTNSMLIGWRYQKPDGTYEISGGTTNILSSASRSGNGAMIDVLGEGAQLVVTNGDTVSHTYRILLWGRI